MPEVLPDPQAHRLSRPTSRLPSGVEIWCNTGDSPSTRERKMRQAFMSIQEVINTYVEDMKLHEHFEPWDFGACRRR